MRPGVTYLPLPSTTRAPSGTGTSVPTESIVRLRSRTSPFSIVSPAAVMTVAFRMTVGSAGSGS